MKLRTDLLRHLTTEDILEEAAANQHRYIAEPTFSKTGIGTLLPASAEERSREVIHCAELTQKMEERVRRNGSAPGGRS